MLVRVAGLAKAAVLAGAAVLLSGGAWAQVPAVPPVRIDTVRIESAASQLPQSQIDAILREPAVSRAHWGISVVALDASPLYQRDAETFFRPASVAKLFTTSAAMALLGPGSTVRTRLAYTTDDSGNADGLVWTGSYDANLSGRLFPYTGGSSAAGTAAKHPDQPLAVVQELAAQLRSEGIRHIHGGVMASAAPWDPYPQGWGTDDLLWGYGAPVTALGLDDNEVLLTVTPGLHAGEPATATLTPDIGYYTLDDDVHTVAAKQPAAMSPFRDAGSRIVHLRGTVAAGEPYTTHLAVDDPPLYAAMALRQALVAAGISVDGDGTAAAREYAGDPDNFLHDSREPVTLPVAAAAAAASQPPGPGQGAVDHISPTLAEDVVFTLKTSQNLHAESILRRLGLLAPAADPPQPPLVAGERVLRQWLLNAGIAEDEFVFWDGSGLSAKDIVTPHAIAQLLVYDARQPWFGQWRAALPVGGVDGTLRHRFGPETGLAGRVFAKTGTLGESRALAGYLVTATGRTVAFVVMCDDHAPGTSDDRQAMDRVVAAIAAAY